MKLLLLFTVCFWTLIVDVRGAVFTEDFKSGTSQIVAKGWKLGRTKKVVKDGVDCIEISNSKDMRSAATFFVGVVPGKRYSLSCMIKTEQVKTARANYNRKATVFAEWADGKKKYVTGGVFPIGFDGTQDWQKFQIPFTNSVPDGVAYIKVWLNLDGKGKCWFKDLVVEEFNGWKPLAIIQPQAGSTERVTRPELIWSSVPKHSWEVYISSDAGFRKDLKRYQVGNKTEFQIPDFLPCGSKWYWQVRDSGSPKNTKEVFATSPASFSIASDVEQWPPIVKTDYVWSDDPRPELKVDIIGSIGNVEVEINGKSCSIKENTGGHIVFQPDADIKQGLHTINFSVASKRNGNKKTTLVTTYCNQKPGVKVTYKDGITYIDDKSFFPIGSFHVPSDKLLDFADVKDAGFNLTHSYAFHKKRKNVDLETAKKYLEEAHKNNMMVFQTIRRDWVIGRDSESIRKYVETLMSYKSLLSWYLYDEPELHHIPPSVMQSANKAVKSVDPFHPTLIVSHSVDVINDVCRQYADAADSFSCDPYPGEAGKPMSLVYNWVANCRTIVGKDRPVWAVIEAFDVEFWKGRKKFRKVKEFGPVTKPTYKEIRCMVYLALAGGADGIIFYWLPTWAYHIRKDAPEVWNSITMIIKELKELQPFTLTPRNMAQETLKPTPPFYFWIRKNAEGKYLLAVINYGRKATKLRRVFQLPGDRKVTVDDKFDPLEVKVYYPE